MTPTSHTGQEPAYGRREPSATFLMWPLSAADLPALVRLEAACNPAPLSEQALRDEFAGGASRLVGAFTLGQDLAGYCLYRTTVDEVEIHRIATMPCFRRRGVARRLVESALTHAATRGAIAAFLEVRAGNAAALALYRAVGFEPIAVRARYYPDGEDAVVMRRSL